jgi:hypothetical protein
MIRLEGKEGQLYHLNEYAILENEDGTYEYIGWDSKDEQVTWIRGEVRIFGDVLGLMNITSDGEEETMETLLEVKHELHQLPRWDKTKYHCVVVGGRSAALIKYCETGLPLEVEGGDYQEVKEMLTQYGLILQ